MVSSCSQRLACSRFGALRGYSGSVSRFYLTEMFLKKFPLAVALGCAAVSASAFIGTPAQAACLSTTGEMPTPNNNCTTYNTMPPSPVRATLFYQDTNLGNPYWQLTGATSTIANFSDWEFSSDGTSWTSFNPGFTASGSAQAGTIFDNSTTPSAPAGNPFYIRVTLSDSAILGATYQIALRTNNDKAVDGLGRLDDTGGNLASNLTRNFTRQPNPEVPGPLPLLGAAAAFGYSRKIRKVIRAAG